jgi:hypothetical protein
MKEQANTERGRAREKGEDNCSPKDGIKMSKL